MMNGNDWPLTFFNHNRLVSISPNLPDTYFLYEVRMLSDFGNVFS